MVIARLGVAQTGERRVQCSGGRQDSGPGSRRASGRTGGRGPGVRDTGRGGPGRAGAAAPQPVHRPGRDLRGRDCPGRGVRAAAHRGLPARPQPRPAGQRRHDLGPEHRLGHAGLGGPACRRQRAGDGAVQRPAGRAARRCRSSGPPCRAPGALVGNDAIFRPGPRVQAVDPLHRPGAGRLRRRPGPCPAALLGKSAAAHFTTRGYSQLRLGQLLSQLGYLPLTWAPSQAAATRAEHAERGLPAAQPAGPGLRPARGQLHLAARLPGPADQHVDAGPRERGAARRGHGLPVRARDDHRRRRPGRSCGPPCSRPRRPGPAQRQRLHLRPGQQGAAGER